MERTSRATWSKRVERWKESGLSAEEFAEKAGLRATTLTWWKWRLGADERAKTPRALAVRSEPAKAPPELTPMTFIEMTASVRAEPLEIVLRSEVRVRVPASFDERTLSRLLDVLERRR